MSYKDGKEWALDTVKTTGAAAALALAVDRSAIRADGLDLAFVTVRITDREGLTVPRSNKLVRFGLSGPGEIVAVDNGDATSFEPFLAKQRKAFNGLCLVIVKGHQGDAGRMTLKAESDGLAGGEIVIRSQ